MVNMDRQSSFDVAVIGGGPAGLAAAIAMRRKGLHVLVADRARPPIDKPCGEGLMPDGVEALSRLGISIEPGRSLPFRGIRFIQEDASVEACFPGGHGLGIRRTTLHEILIDHALQAGVSLSWGTPVTGFAPDGLQLHRQRIRTRWIVAADGGNSRARQWMHLEEHRTERMRFGFVAHVAKTPWTDFVEVYWGDDCQVVITPVSPREICVAIATRNPKLRLESALESIGALSDRLEGPDVIGKERGALCGLRVLRRIVRGRCAAVGDASGSVDSLTGKGVCLAFRQALSLADAIAEDDISLYESAHRTIGRVPVLMSRLMLMMDSHPGLRRRALRALAAKPEIFSRLLAGHVATNCRDGGVSGLLSLGRLMLTN